LKVLEGLGAQVREIDSAPFIDARFPNSLIILSEANAYHEVNLAQQPQNYGKATRDRVREGALISAVDYIQSQRARTAIREQMREILTTVDVIASPTQPQAATKFTDLDGDARYRRPSYTNPYNLTGLPAISIPAGFTSDGRPIGLQIAGRGYDEATVLQVSYAYESATSWTSRHPPI
jgi:aspartyl-tRNA(Asn)/glutamyl-tRNA(Gln) amidotransferase subunit A